MLNSLFISLQSLTLLGRFRSSFCATCYSTYYRISISMLLTIPLRKRHLKEKTIHNQGCLRVHGPSKNHLRNNSRSRAEEIYGLIKICSCTSPTRDSIIIGQIDVYVPHSRNKKRPGNKACRRRGNLHHYVPSLQTGDPLYTIISTFVLFTPLATQILLVTSIAHIAKTIDTTQTPNRQKQVNYRLRAKVRDLIGSDSNGRVAFKMVVLKMINGQGQMCQDQERSDHYN